MPHRSPVSELALPQEHRDAISRGQQLRWLRTYEQQGEPPDKKRCTQCGEFKRVDREDPSKSEFSIRKRKLATGLRLYPAPECRECGRARSAAWRAQKRATGELSELQARWNASRDPEQRASYQREYGRMRRVLDGVTPRGPWRKYRIEEADLKVDAEPFLSWFDQLLDDRGRAEERASRYDRGSERERLAEHAAISLGLATQSVLRALRRARLQGDISIRLVDALTTAAGYPDQTIVLYPPECYSS